jgi:hypothetical protein
MSTIPTTFSDKIAPYTAVGGKECTASNGLSAVILNRQGRYPRRTFFQELEKTGFENVVSIESSSRHYDIEELSERFPFVRFIIPEREINPGEQINLAASEIESPLFFVLWNDLKIIAGGTARRMMERLCIDHENNNGTNLYKRLCTVPVIMNARYEIMPTMIVPVTARRKMRTTAMEPYFEGHLSIYPFDGVGIYDRRRFIEIGGFDITLSNTHWQFMDFGFRAQLWGEEIAAGLQYKLLCDGEIPAIDYTADKSYRRYYLKNIAPVFNGDYTQLPLSRFPGYMLKSGEDIFSAWGEFSECRNWVNANRLKWRRNTRDVTNCWNENSCQVAKNGSDRV